MNKTLHLSIASALLALSACNSDKPEVIDRGPQDPLGDQLNNAAPVALPPSVKVSKTYRCGDGRTRHLLGDVERALLYKSSRGIHLRKLPTKAPG
jgi:hypothetical protein